MSNPGLKYDHLMDLLKDIQLQVRAMPARVASVVVAPDVFKKLTEDIPICKDVKLTDEVHIFIGTWLPPGTIVPLDTEGKPFLAPKKVP